MTRLHGNPKSKMQKFYIKPADDEAVFFILKHMRPQDRQEILATEFDDDLKRIAIKFAQGCDMAWVFCDGDGKAVAFLGGVKLWPNAGQVGFVATDDWPKVALSVSRWLYQNKLFILRHYGLKHVFCFMHSQYKQNAKWLKWLGFEAKGQLDGFGKNGEDLTMMSLCGKGENTNLTE